MIKITAMKGTSGTAKTTYGVHTHRSDADADADEEGEEREGGDLGKEK